MLPKTSTPLQARGPAPPGRVCPSPNQTPIEARAPTEVRSKSWPASSKFHIPENYRPKAQPVVSITRGKVIEFAIHSNQAIHRTNLLHDCSVLYRVIGSETNFPKSLRTATPPREDKDQ
jgi:hypothetical protein